MDMAKFSASLHDFNPDFFYAQWAHETDGFTSELCHEHHNLAGLTALSGSPSMKQPDGDFFYRSFKSVKSFAVAFAEYIDAYRADGIYEANSIDDYVYALYRGGYFGADPEEYLRGCKKWLATIR